MKKLIFITLSGLCILSCKHSEIQTQNNLSSEIKQDTLHLPQINPDSTQQNSKIIFPFDEAQPQKLSIFLLPFKNDYYVSDKIKGDVNGDGLPDYIIILRNKIEKQIKIDRDGETVYPPNYDPSERLIRYFLLLTRTTDDKYLLTLCSTTVIPSGDHSNLWDVKGNLISSYLSPKIDTNCITIITQRSLENSHKGGGMRQMNLKFIYHPDIKKWILESCLTKYIHSIAVKNFKFETECELTPENFGKISLDIFDVYEFNSESLGCNGMKRLIEDL